MKKALFIDRDGTLVIEPPIDYQLDSFHKLEFYPKVFRNLGFIRSKLAKTVNLRNTPEIRFVLDQSIEYGVKMSKMIDEVTKDIKSEDDAEE